MNLFKNTNNNKRYYTLDYFLKKKFKSKVFKISLDAGFSCPNKDGKIGFGGCIYCLNGSKSNISNNEDLIKQFNEIKNKLSKKWPNSKYIAYFQAGTNTYAPLKILKEKYETVLNLDNVVGISIATRADAISKDCLDYLIDLNKRTYLTIELGLQTIHDKTSKLINRCHDLNTFDKMVKLLRKNNINVVVHIINGLPGETRQMMIDTVKHINNLDIQGIKIHMLHILKNTKLSKLYYEKPFKILEKNEYVDIVCEQIENLNDNIVINRLTGDPDKKYIIEPTWSLKKLSVIDDIDKILEKRKTYQGFNLNIDNYVKREITKVLRNNDLVITKNYKDFIDENYLVNYVDMDKSYKNKISLIITSDIKKIDNYYNLLNKKGILLLITKENNFKINYDYKKYSVDCNTLLVITKYKKIA